MLLNILWLLRFLCWLFLGKEIPALLLVTSSNVNSPQQWRFFFPPHSDRISPDTNCTHCLLSRYIVVLCWGLFYEFVYWRLLFCSIIGVPKYKMQHMLKAICNFIFPMIPWPRESSRVIKLILREFAQFTKDLEKKFSGYILIIQSSF